MIPGRRGRLREQIERREHGEVAAALSRLLTGVRISASRLGSTGKIRFDTDPGRRQGKDFKIVYFKDHAPEEVSSLEHSDWPAACQRI